MSVLDDILEDQRVTLVDTRKRMIKQAINELIDEACETAAPITNLRKKVQEL